MLTTATKMDGPRDKRDCTKGKKGFSCKEVQNPQNGSSLES
jgi:hypothetical protein